VKTVTGEPVSPQKLAVMTAHASMCFLTTMIKENCAKTESGYHVDMDLDTNLYENWMNGSFTKVLLAAKSLNDLQKAVKRCEENDLVEGKDYFLIRDNCYTELVPDEGEETCFIAIGFTPMEEEKVKPITKKYQLYH
jgi:PTH2 family peptidyl-tRNA hydrolase